MFGTEVKDEPNFIWFLIQQFAGPIVPWLIAFGITLQIDELTRVPGLPQEDNWALWFSTCCLAGLFCGFLVGRWLPAASKTGLLVWIIPSFLFATAFVRDSLLWSFPNRLLKSVAEVVPATIFKFENRFCAAAGAFWG
jgi:hypothetical protein